MKNESEKFITSETKIGAVVLMPQERIIVQTDNKDPKYIVTEGKGLCSLRNNNDEFMHWIKIIPDFILEFNEGDEFCIYNYGEDLLVLHEVAIEDSNLEGI